MVDRWPETIRPKLRQPRPIPSRCNRSFHRCAELASWSLAWFNLPKLYRKHYAKELYEFIACDLQSCKRVSAGDLALALTLRPFSIMLRQIEDDGPAPSNGAFPEIIGSHCVA